MLQRATHRPCGGGCNAARTVEARGVGRGMRLVEGGVAEAGVADTLENEPQRSPLLRLSPGLPKKLGERRLAEGVASRSPGLPNLEGERTEAGVPLSPTGLANTEEGILLVDTGVALLARSRGLAAEAAAAVEAARRLADAGVPLSALPEGLAARGSWP